MPSRRTFLAGAAAASAGLAGCTGVVDPESAYSPGTDETAEWQFPDHDRTGTAYNSEAVAPRDGVSERWSVEIPNANRRAVVGDGTVFVPSTEELVALDLASGDERWSFAPSEESWATSPTLQQGTVYAGFDSERSLWALDASSGQVQWSLDTRGNIEAGVFPSRKETQIYAGDDTGRVYVVESDGSVEHSYDVVGPVTALGTRTGTVTVGTSGGQVYELYDDGSAFYPLWQRRVAGGVQDLSIEDGGSVLVSVFGNYVYKLQGGAHAGTNRWRTEFTANNFLATQSHVVGTNLSKLAVIDAQSGERRWSRSGKFTCAPAGAGDTFYVGGERDSGDGFLTAYPLGDSGRLLSGSPERRWTRDIPGVPTGGLTVADGALVVTTWRKDGPDRVRVFDPA